LRAELTLSCSLVSLEGLRVFCSKNLLIWDVPEDVSKKLTLALDEACTNAIKHGHRCNPKENILIVLEKKKGSILFKVHDIGSLPENLSAHLDKPLSALIKERKKGGLGLKLMHRIMDDVRFITTNGVTSCIMIKNI
jgi:serine/threonine-protein kinase RsbW